MRWNIFKSDVTAETSFYVLKTSAVFSQFVKLCPHKLFGECVDGCKDHSDRLTFTELLCIGSLNELTDQDVCIQEFQRPITISKQFCHYCKGMRLCQSLILRRITCFRITVLNHVNVHGIVHGSVLNFTEIVHFCDDEYRLVLRH